MVCTSRGGLVVNRVEAPRWCACALPRKSCAPARIAARSTCTLSLLRLGNDAGDLSCPRRCGVERFVEQAGEALQPLAEILGARVERRDQGLDCCVSRGDRFVGAAVARVEQFDCVGERASVRAELVASSPRSRSTLAVTSLKVPRCCSTLAVSRRRSCCARSFMAATNSETRVAIVCSIELMFS